MQTYVIPEYVLFLNTQFWETLIHYLWETTHLNECAELIHYLMQNPSSAVSRARWQAEPEEADIAMAQSLTWQDH